MSTDNFLDYVDSAMEAYGKGLSSGQRIKIHRTALSLMKSFKFQGAEFSWVDHDPAFDKVFANGGTLTLMEVRFLPKVLKSTDSSTLKSQFTTALNNHVSKKLGNYKLKYSWNPSGNTLVKMTLP